MWMRLLCLSFIVLSLFATQAHAGLLGVQKKLLSYCHAHYDPKGLLRADRFSLYSPEEVCNCIADKGYTVLTGHKSPKVQDDLNQHVRLREKEKNAIAELKNEIIDGGKNVTETLFIKACKPYAKMEEDIQVNDLSAAEAASDFEKMRDGLNALMVKHDAVASPLEVYCRRKARFDYYEARYLTEAKELKATLLEIETQSFDVTADAWLMQSVYPGVFRAKKLARYCPAISK
tara:strand:- start:240 stop:935 length:696 start_codon:yes stop_codon:yes gene_type:complete